ncbi:MAG TPA: hypothetical protein VMR73_00905 [Candidatus Paceibacterota bacterium]|nr:hypothetical protein [Candidatus Paceibacterota bacterium]
MDNTTETNETKIPKEITRAVKTVGVDSQLVTISEKYNLHVDQAGGLAAETYMIIAGTVDGSEFVDDIENDLGISREIAVQIATDINNQIFLKIRQLLQEESGEQETGSVSSGEREQTLDAIENPIPTKPTTSLVNAPERELVNKTATDDFIGKKMSPDNSAPKDIPVNPITKKYDSDPYREPLS